MTLCALETDFKFDGFSWLSQSQKAINIVLSIEDDQQENQNGGAEEQIHLIQDTGNASEPGGTL